MSLITDKFFFNAIRANTAIWNEVGGRVFNPARSTVDENEDRVPYIIITLDGVTNDTGTKDDVEGDTDSVQIGILCVHHDRESLGALTEAVRNQCIDYLHLAEEGQVQTDDSIIPIDWTFTAEGVQYDEVKPCVYQQLHYMCDTKR